MEVKLYFPTNARVSGWRAARGSGLFDAIAAHKRIAGDASQPLRRRRM
jgi:hypothetical protein